MLKSLAGIYRSIGYEGKESYLCLGSCAVSLVCCLQFLLKVLNLIFLRVITDYKIQIPEEVNILIKNILIWLLQEDINNYPDHKKFTVKLLT
jgi:hypothetical protein